jgi:GMP synthase (glutamine-hydrolysing)
LKKKEELKVLLLQIRRDQQVRREEHESFCDYSGLAQSQIDIHNVFDCPIFEPDIVDGYDALFVGGASDASVLEPDVYTFVPSSEKLLRACIDRGLPVFASCFGFQLVVTALGGTIVHTPENFEMGTVPISLRPEAKDDPVFRHVSDGFQAVSVHQPKTMTPPENCIELAYTAECCHSFKVIGKPFWAFQFHPEVDRARLVERLTFYKEKYTDDDGHLDEVLASAVETPESNGLVRNFVDRVLVAGEGV